MHLSLQVVFNHHQLHTIVYLSTIHTLNIDKAPDTAHIMHQLLTAIQPLLHTVTPHITTHLVQTTIHQIMANHTLHQHTTTPQVTHITTVDLGLKK